jgi:hypothetical protein
MSGSAPLCATGARLVKGPSFNDAGGGQETARSLPARGPYAEVRTQAIRFGVPDQVNAVAIVPGTIDPAPRSTLPPSDRRPSPFYVLVGRRPGRVRKVRRRSASCFVLHPRRPACQPPRHEPESSKHSHRTYCSAMPCMPPLRERRGFLTRGEACHILGENSRSLWALPEQKRKRTPSYKTDS